MYLSASRPNVEGDLAVLALPPIQANLQSTCSIRFYYHMIGNHVGQLNIYKRNHVGLALRNDFFIVSNCKYSFIHQIVLARKQ